MVSVLVGAPLLLGVHFVAEGTDFGRALKDSAGAAIADGRVLALALREALSGRVVAGAFEVADEPVGAVGARVEAAAASGAASAADNIGEVFEVARVSPEIHAMTETEGPASVASAPSPRGIHAITGAKRPGRKPVEAVRMAWCGKQETWRQRRDCERDARIAARRAETEVRHPRDDRSARNPRYCREAVLATFNISQLAIPILDKRDAGWSLTSAETGILAEARRKERAEERICGRRLAVSERGMILVGFGVVEQWEVDAAVVLESLVGD